MNNSITHSNLNTTKISSLFIHHSTSYNYYLSISTYLQYAICYDRLLMNILLINYLKLSINCITSFLSTAQHHSNITVLLISHSMLLSMSLYLELHLFFAYLSSYLIYLIFSHIQSLEFVYSLLMMLTTYGLSILQGFMPNFIH